MSFKYDVAVAWRIYPKISKSPLVFDNDKYELMRLCLLSFIKAIPGLKIKFFFILDGCPISYRNCIEQLFSEHDFEIIETDSIGNLPTFQLQINLLADQNDAELVYFAEDDYLYVPGKFHSMVSMMHARPKVDFATCYFHSDILNHPLHRTKNHQLMHQGQEWISINSTCLTFMTRKKVLQDARKILETYAKGNNDCAMWLVLTKKFIYNPFHYIRFLFTHKESYNILKTAVKYSFIHFFTFRKYNLWVARPALATHLEREFISPGIDWKKLAAETIENS